MNADSIPAPPNYAVKLVAVACIWAVTILNMITRHSGSQVQNVTAVAKFLGLILICILGIIWLAKGTYISQFHNAFADTSSDFWPYGTGLYLALFSVRNDMVLLYINVVWLLIPSKLVQWLE
jgi:amino acid transporter